MNTDIKLEFKQSDKWCHCSPQWVLCVLPVILLSQCPRQEEDDPCRHHEETNHRGDGDAHHQRLGNILLAVLTTIPPVLSNPAPAAKVTGSIHRDTTPPFQSLLQSLSYIDSLCFVCLTTQPGNHRIYYK